MPVATDFRRYCLATYLTPTRGPRGRPRGGGIRSWKRSDFCEIYYTLHLAGSSTWRTSLWSFSILPGSLLTWKDENNGRYGEKYWNWYDVPFSTISWRVLISIPFTKCSAGEARPILIFELKIDDGGKDAKMQRCTVFEISLVIIKVCGKFQ